MSFLKERTRHLDFKQHGREWESCEVFLLGRDGLNNDAVKIFKAFQS